MEDTPDRMTRTRLARACLKARAKKRWTQAMLAEAAELSTLTIVRLETGARIPNRATLVKIAAVMPAMKVFVPKAPDPMPCERAS